MKDNRRILGLKKTPAQAATERHEDALLQKVALEGGDPESTAGVVPTGTPAPKPLTFKDEPYAGESPPADDDVIKLDESVPYATVRGIPGVEFIQGKDFYDRGKCMVREAPVEQWYFAEAPSKATSAMAKADEARAELRRKGLLDDHTTPRLPRQLLDALRENARAAAAEANAA